MLKLYLIYQDRDNEIKLFEPFMDKEKEKYYVVALDSLIPIAQLKYCRKNIYKDKINRVNTNNRPYVFCDSIEAGVEAMNVYYSGNIIYHERKIEQFKRYKDELTYIKFNGSKIDIETLVKPKRPL